MKSYKKVYIGKGKPSAKFPENIVVTLPVEEVLKYKHEFKGVEYITFEVAEMKKPDDYDRTHTAFVSIPENDEVDNSAAEQEVETTAGKKKRGRPSKVEIAAREESREENTEDAPF